MFLEISSGSGLAPIVGVEPKKVTLRHGTAEFKNSDADR